ncbi:MAG: hypothetical protein J6Q51_03715 [Clostridia bacterium]|nr:hypothetical protein [Clostridia bacterium]
MLNTIKKYLKKFKKLLVFYYFLLILVLLLPNALTMPSLSFKSAIATAIGLDSVDNGIEISVLTLSDISKDNTSEKTKILSAKDSNISKAISSIEFQIDRKIRMGHVGYVVISKALATQNVGQMLNNLIVSTNLPKTVSLVMSEDKAKDVLNLANKLEHTSSYKLREIIQNEFNENYTKDSNLDLFLKGYFSHISTSTMGSIYLSSNTDDGLNTNNEETGGNDTDNKTQQKSSSLSSNQEKSVINYKKEHAVFVDGLYKYTLSPDEMIGVNLLGENDLKQIFTINNVFTQGLENAQVTFEIKNKQIQTLIEYRNGKPIIEYDIALNINPIEIIQDNKKRLSPQELRVDEEVNQKINDQVKKYVAIAIEKMRQEKTDLINIYEILYTNSYKKFMSFLENLDIKEDFLSFVQVKIKVSSKIMTN